LKIFVAIAALFLAPFATQADEDHIRWTRNGAPSETYITGGPWTLEQSGAAGGLKSAGYCSTNGIQIGNPGTQRMQPYYFPFLTGHEKYLQGYFDWRPLSPQPGLLLKGFPATNDGPTDATTALPENRLSYHRVAESRWYSANRSPQLAAGDYRTIGRVGLHTEHEIAAIGQSGDDQ